ncbi:hypothetical protein BU15DRAFT_88065 [Melanogaster broomeanus]|nr:hypothetical protein BU15DRAFT_88065 [Melanogaster broomeanus]
MSPNNFKSFAIAGVANTVGVPTIKVVDYSDVNAVAAVLKEHSVDTSLADAAKAAAVQLFVPSEFGVPTGGATEGIFGIKNQVAAHLKAIGLPSLRLYTGAFIEWIPWVYAIPETGKVHVVSKGDTPGSYCALDDIGAYLAYILTTVEPTLLSDTEIRIEGYRATGREITALYEGKVPIEIAESIPSHVPMADFRMLIQRGSDTGLGSTGWDRAAGKEIHDPKGGNKLYPDFKWKTVKEVLGL